MTDTVQAVEKHCAECLSNGACKQARIKADLIDLAYHYAKDKHEGQFRRITEEPYFTHAAAVAKMVADHGGSFKEICAAYLHDVQEDCGVTTEELKGMFGEDIANLVNQLTAPQDIKFKDKHAFWGKRIREISASALFIKLCDILVNLNDKPTKGQINRYSFIHAECEKLLQEVGLGEYSKAIGVFWILGTTLARILI